MYDGDDRRYRPEGYPVRHRRKVPFEPRFSLDMGTRAMFRAIRSMDAELGGLVRDPELVLDAVSSNVHWSTAIEGNGLSLREVRELAGSFVSGEAPGSPSEDERDVLNHLEVLLGGGVPGMPLTVEAVTGLHGRLTEGLTGYGAGSIRDVDVCVAAPDGTELFIACSHGSVRDELESLVDWANSSPFDEVPTAVLFYHEFESTHPFLDGNGRTGRLILRAVLAGYGLPIVDMCRLEERMLSDTGAYYDLLAYTDATGDCTPIVRRFTECIRDAYEGAVREFSRRRDRTIAVDRTAGAPAGVHDKRFIGGEDGAHSGPVG